VPVPRGAFYCVGDEVDVAASARRARFGLVLFRAIQARQMVRASRGWQSHRETVS